MIQILDRGKILDYYLAMFKESRVAARVQAVRDAIVVASINRHARKEGLEDNPDRAIASMSSWVGDILEIAGENRHAKLKRRRHESLARDTARRAGQSR